MSEGTESQTKPNRSLEIAVEQEEAWKRRLTITVAPDRVATARGRERRRVGKSVRLKGFRKGKVPPHIIEDRYGQLIDERTVTTLIEQTYVDALREKDLQPIGEPAFGDVQYDPGRSLTFQVRIEIMPEVKLQRVSGFRVQRPEVRAPEEEVDGIVQRLREERAVLEPVERPPEDGDVVSVLVRHTDEPELEEGERRPARFELGAGDAIPEVEDAIRTLAPGEVGEFEVNFPDGFEDAELAGAARSLRIELLDVKAKRLPELDDEFAGEVSEFESLDALIEAVREDVRLHHEKEADRAVRERLIDSVIEANPFEVPPTLIDRYLDRVMEVPEDAETERVEEARRSLGPAIERQIKRQLILERLIEEQGLKATGEELEERLADLAEKTGTDQRKIRRRLVREKRFDAFEEQIAADKAFSFLEAQSTIEK